MRVAAVFHVRAIRFVERERGAAPGSARTLIDDLSRRGLGFKVRWQEVFCRHFMAL